MKTINLDGVEYELVPKVDITKKVVVDEWVRIIPESNQPVSVINWNTFGGLKGLSHSAKPHSENGRDCVHIHREYELDQDGRILSMRDLTKEKQDE